MLPSSFKIPAKSYASGLARRLPISCPSVASRNNAFILNPPSSENNDDALPVLSDVLANSSARLRPKSPGIKLSPPLKRLDISKLSRPLKSTPRPSELLNKLDKSNSCKSVPSADRSTPDDPPSPPNKLERSKLLLSSKSKSISISS